MEALGALRSVYSKKAGLKKGAEFSAPFSVTSNYQASSQGSM
jgi:hypothetical protein